jgi:hypothetical protein
MRILFKFPIAILFGVAIFLVGPGVKCLNLSGDNTVFVCALVGYWLGVLDGAIHDALKLLDNPPAT